MWKNNLSLRVAGPTILVSLLLWALCAAAAVYLFIQQSGSAEAFREDVSSTQVAHDLANTLNNLIALLRERSEQVGPLHQRVAEQLQEAELLANKDEEKRLVRDTGPGEAAEPGHHPRQPAYQAPCTGNHDRPIGGSGRRR